MPRLRDDDGPRADAWIRLGEDEPVEIAVNPVVSHHRLTTDAKALRAHNGPIGVDLPNDSDLSVLDGWLDRIGMISVAFPSFADGRGFSLGRRIRALGFSGELRARGPVIADQFAFLRACGFDTVESPDGVAERQPEAQWRKAGEAISLSYQRGYRGPSNILDARRAGRA